MVKKIAKYSVFALVGLLIIISVFMNMQTAWEKYKFKILTQGASAALEGVINEVKNNGQTVLNLTTPDGKVETYTLVQKEK